MKLVKKTVTITPTKSFSSGGISFSANRAVPGIDLLMARKWAKQGYCTFSDPLQPKPKRKRKQSQGASENK